MKKVFLFMISCASLNALHAQVKHVTTKPAAAKQATVKQSTAPRTQATTISRPKSSQTSVKETQAPVITQARESQVRQSEVREPEVRYVPVKQTAVRHSAVRTRSSSQLEPMTFGIKGGMNIAKIGGPDASGLKSKIGFNAGGFVNIPVAHNFSIQPELMFSMQGAKETGVDGFGDAATAKYNLSYINMPVMARYTSEIGLFAETGPQIGFLVGAQEKQGGAKANISDRLKKVDFAWTFGAGYITPANIGFNVRYDMGISKIGSSGTARQRNNVFQVGVFYVIGNNK